MGFPLDRGSIEDGILTCHWHHTRFDLASGCTFDLWADDVPTCPTDLRGSEIWVKPTFAQADPAEHWGRRLHDGLTHDLGLVIAKAVHGELAAGVPPPDVIRQMILFGAHSRDGGAWASRFSPRSQIFFRCCRRRRSISPSSMALAVSRMIASGKRRARSGRRLRAGLTLPRLSAGCGVGRLCAIARLPSEPC